MRDAPHSFALPMPPRLTLARQTLVRLAPPAWRHLIEQHRDAATIACLAHWAAHDLPLVVTRQPPLPRSDRIALGLPAPLRWGRRKIAVHAPCDAIRAQVAWPTLDAAVHALPSGTGPAVQALARALRAHAVDARVYGSVGWQCITGLAYVGPASDLDLLIDVRDDAHADALVRVLHDAQIGVRLDGELIWPDASAIAWREWWRAMCGDAQQVLVKRFDGVTLRARRSACTAADTLARRAVQALYRELALYPKPGLVSFVDAGSHDDMDARTFMRSLFALRGYFRHVALAGARGEPFDVLERLGIDAERRMLHATGGVNTHRGAIFTLGLIVAATARAQGSVGDGSVDAQAIRDALRSTWGGSLRARADRRRATPVDAAPTHGQRAAARTALRTASDEAADGFPTLFDVTIPALRAARGASDDEAAACVHALLATVAVLDDTTLVHRGGVDGLRFAQTAARAWIDARAVAPDVAHSRAIALHRAFVARRLSAGGAADLFAAAWFIERVREHPRA